MNTHHPSMSPRPIAPPPVESVSRIGRHVVLGLVTAAGLCLPTLGRAAIVLQDDFDYADNAALQANWTTLAENSPTMVQASTSVAGAPFGSLANGVIQRPLLETVSNFTLTIDLISSESERRQSVGVFDASGRNGYFFSIDNGYLLINEVSIPEATPLSRQAYYDNMTTLSSGDGVPGSSAYFAPVLYVNSGLVNFFPAGSASETPMTTFTFSLQEDGTMQLSADGNLIFEGSDTTLTSFSSVVILGNTFGYFNDLTVEAVPEPATALLVGVGALGFALRRRQMGVAGRASTR